MEHLLKVLVRPQFALILFFGYSTVGSGSARGGSVGCLYQHGICAIGKEWCYDDGIFGQCLPLKTQTLDLSTILHRNFIGEFELATLEAVLTELKRRGYHWNDRFTQCVLQRLFFYFKNQGSGTLITCLELQDNKEKDKNSEERNEFEKKNNIFLQKTNVAGQDTLQAPIYLSQNNLLGIEDIMKHDLVVHNSFLKKDYVLKEFDMLLAKKHPGVDNSRSKVIDQYFRDSIKYPYLFYKDDGQQLTSLQHILSSVDKDKAYIEPPQSDLLFDSNEDDINIPIPSSVYTNAKFERQERLDVKKPGPWFSVNNYAFKQDEDDRNTLFGKLPFSNGPTGFEERYLPTTLLEDITPHRNFRKNYRTPTKSKDERRLPTQDYLDISNEENDTKEYFSKDSIGLSTRNIPGNSLAKEIGNPITTTEMQPKEKMISFIPAHFDRKNAEANYVSITIKGEFLNWKQGAEFVNVFCDLLKLPHDTYYDVSVEKNKVSFNIETKGNDMNSSLIASKADQVRLKMHEITGLEMDTIGIGDQQSSVSSVLFWRQENQQMLFMVGMCVLTTAVIVSAAIFLILRSRHIGRQKLKEFAQSVDTEASRDYQDLCRSRMAIKGSNPEQNKDSSKIPHALLSRDSESSRSSTSSWCEEPVLTNMDISTGHIVLTYMEDHLRNKFRLDQEWQTLCAYEAETSAGFLVASKFENNEKNRYSDVLPYDHSRVVLNSMANNSGLDYINASSITDHDPRHPAYIAAQSPIAASLSDFWQMVWEQGSVVLVLLTKVFENGEELCHKYWPEEGSQLYHIYEVHLVSEHIWCDDYLVRSFYLKNIRTGETRTVTQFHFQSWPENGVPSSTKALLEFRRKVNKSYRGRSCPIVVHCSDGAGRTGTYCLIDMVLHRMSKGAREIDIAATLEHLRDQRPHAVRTKQQFEFVLTAVAEEVHAILRALPQ